MAKRVSRVNFHAIYNQNINIYDQSAFIICLAAPEEILIL